MRVQEYEPIKDRLTPLGKFLRVSGVAKFYHNGDGASFIWRWWHPLSWIFVPIVFLLYGFFEGFPTAWMEREDLGIGYPKWAKDDPSSIVWDGQEDDKSV